MERNTGIDLLRVFSMLLIVTLHVIGHGGILETAENAEMDKYVAIWAIRIFAYCGAIVFALVSGFVAYYKIEKSVRFSNLIELWITVVFYNLLILFVFWAIYPNDFNVKDIIKSVLPISMDSYWYFTAYACMFLFSPILNYIGKNLDKEKFTKLILLIVVAFSVYSTTAGRIKDPFSLEHGYGFVWICSLYLIGMYINKFNVYKAIKTKHCCMAILISYLITLGFKLLFSSKSGAIGDMLVFYLSPTILAIAICWVLIFGNIKKNTITKSIAAFFGPTTFGIYLIHDNDLIKHYIINERFASFTNFKLYEMLALILIIVVGIFVVCSLVDKVRAALFKIFKINKISNFVEKKGKIIFHKTTHVISKKIEI